MMDKDITIILVEDDMGHARLIEKNLRRAGISNRIIHLSSGNKALEYFHNNEHSSSHTLILLDLNLPEIDGYDILQFLKSTPKTKSIPVIVLTTTDNPKEIDRCYELGCNVYITKPVEYIAFTDAIRKLGLMLAIVRIPGEN